jgi:glycosyltransferase involved in cell wall biosynthesis
MNTKGHEVRVALLAHLHHVIAEPFTGGMEAHTSMVANELVLRGHEVTLFAKQGSATLAQLEPILGPDFEFGQIANGETRDRLLDEAVTRALIRIEDGRFDVVLNNSLSPLPYSELRSWPMLTILHTPPTLEKVNAVIDDPLWQPGPRHRYVGVSHLNAQSWRAKLPRVECVPNGIYLDRWSGNGPVQPDLAVWSARITPEKGLHLALDAVRKAGMRLEFSGPIADQAYFDAEIRPRLGPDTIHRGHLNHRELQAQLSRAAVFVSSSVWAEPFGLALVEAMACGTPVAAFPNGAAQEVVSRTGGVVAAETSPAALAEAIATAREMDRTLVRRNAERYDAAIMMDRYEELLQELLELPAAVELPEIRLPAVSLTA